MRCWCGYLSGARCRLFAYGPADATAIPNPHRVLRHLNSDWFYLPGTGLPRLSWKRGRLTSVVVLVYLPSQSTFEFSSLQHVKLWSTGVLFRRSLRLELTSWAYPAININSCLQALTKIILLQQISHPEH